MAWLAFFVLCLSTLPGEFAQSVAPPDVIGTLAGGERQTPGRLLGTDLGWTFGIGEILVLRERGRPRASLRHGSGNDDTSDAPPSRPPAAADQFVTIDACPARSEPAVLSTESSPWASKLRTGFRRGTDAWASSCARLRALHARCRPLPVFAATAPRWGGVVECCVALGLRTCVIDPRSGLPSGRPRAGTRGGF